MRIFHLAIISIGFIATAAAELSAAPSRPNVVFILADQWRAQATGYAGDPNVKTPNLDRLAKVSVNFTNAVSGCPVCSPCRASILTGQRPTSHGVFLNDAHLSDDAVTLPKVLAKAGYDTAIIGKWHLNGRGRLSFTLMLIPQIQSDRRNWSQSLLNFWNALLSQKNYQVRKGTLSPA